MTFSGSAAQSTPFAAAVVYVVTNLCVYRALPRTPSARLNPHTLTPTNKDSFTPTHPRNASHRRDPTTTAPAGNHTTTMQSEFSQARVLFFSYTSQH